MHEIIEPFKAARRAFLAKDFSRCDVILPGLDSLIVLGMNAKPEVVDAFVSWARKNRPCDLFILEVDDDV